MSMIGVIPERLKPIIDKMIEDAKKDGVTLRVEKGTISRELQIAIRKNNVIDKSKKNDIDFIMNADPKYFRPITAKPGTSNHEDKDGKGGIAIDFKIMSDPNYPASFNWLTKNANKYGFVRTVKSEKWHWEYRPGLDMFAFVPKTDKSWIV